MHTLVIDNLISSLSRYFATLQRLFRMGRFPVILPVCLLLDLIPHHLLLCFLKSKEIGIIQMLTGLSMCLLHICILIHAVPLVLHFTLLYVVNAYRYFKIQLSAIFSRKLFLISWYGRGSLSIPLHYLPNRSVNLPLLTVISLRKRPLLCNP